MTSAPSTTGIRADGERMFELIRDLFPFCRSITGNGLRATLARIGEELPLQITDVPSGTPVFDWVVPPEWNIRAATIKDANGNVLIDFAKHNLHVVNYSTPVRQRMAWSELRNKLHSLPELPHAIPYKTTYYVRDWGFCIPHTLYQQLEQAGERTYDVHIDAEHTVGSLTYGEYVLMGESTDEVLISTHVCHPSLANDNLSSVGVAVELARLLQQRPQRRWSYRFLFSPATIGVLCWLQANQGKLSRIQHGLILTLLGNDGPVGYKKSRRGDHAIDRVATKVVRCHDEDAEVEEFSPLGYDERQYGSPGINLPIGRLFRAQYGQFPEYHTSDDNLDFVAADNLRSSCEIALEILGSLEDRDCPRTRCPCGEAQLGKRGLFDQPGSESMTPSARQAIAWVLNLADGHHTWDEIAARSGLPRCTIDAAADRLLASELLQ